MSKVKIHKVTEFSYIYPASPEVRVESELTRNSSTDLVTYRLTTTIFGECLSYETHTLSANEDEICDHLVNKMLDELRGKIKTI